MFTEFNTNLQEIQNSVETIIQENQNNVESLLKGEVTYATFGKTFQSMQDKLESAFSQIANLNYVVNSKETQEVYNALLPKVTEYSTKLSQDKRIFEAFQTIKANEYTALTQAQQKVVDNEIRDFKLSGVDLEEEKKQRLQEINIKLSELSNQFSQNVLDATNAFEMIVENEEDVKGIPQSDLESTKFEEEGKVKYRFTLQMPSYIAYMTYGPNGALREKMYQAYVTRAPQNSEVIDEILALKKERCEILGFENYAEYSLATKMANHPKEVVDFLEQLVQKSKLQAKEEFEALEAFAGLKLESWDMSYYAEKLRRERYDLDEEEYRPYFEKNSVVNGLFDFLQKIFGLTFQKAETTLWHEKADAYDIVENGKVTARLYLDLEARETKRGGAWMQNWQTGCINEKGERELPSAFIVCNFPPSSENIPSLLRHDNITTLFHECGHAIHHLLSKVGENFVSGVNGVEWDAIEFPSQFFEEFAYEKSVLKTFAKHYESGEVISDEMIERLKRAKNFQSAMMMLRQIEFALFDFKLHMKLHQGEEVQQLLDEVRTEVSIHIPPAYNKFQNAFSHIFAGGYAAGYYSYKWAEVLSADAFMELIENDFDEKLTNGYKEHILYKGGSQSMKELFLAFLGREAKVDNLLKVSGIENY